VRRLDNAKIRFRVQQGMRALTAVDRDLRHALRLLARTPTFTLAAVATLALGIGANAAIFSLVRTVLLEPLPYRDPNRLVMIWNAADPEGMTWLSMREVTSYGDEVRSLTRVAAYAETDANLTGGTDPERVRAASVTADLFDTLAVFPIFGRSFVPEDGRPGAGDVVILGEDLWMRRYGGDRALLGEVIRVNGRPRTVVGIMPREFRLPLDYRVGRPTEIWIPQIVDPARLGAWGSRNFFAVGRLADDVAPATATSELAAIAKGWIRAGFVPDQGDNQLFRSAVPVQKFVSGAVQRPLLILFGAVGVLLLIACANLINLLLARMVSRRREMAIRAALGAGRGPLVRQLLVESLLLSVGGGGAGLGLAWIGLRGLAASRPPGIPRIEQASLDVGVLLFAAGVAVLTGVAVGLAPAFRLSRPDLSGFLQGGGRTQTPGRGIQTARRGLVIAQLASSVVLVIAAGLLVRSLVSLQRIDLGFDPRGLLTAHLQLPTADYPEPADVVAFYRQFTGRVEDLPGVTAAGVVRVLPLARTIGDWSITLEGRPFVPEENPNADFQVVTPGYFAAMRSTLLRGRLLDSTDREDALLAAVVNDTMAARYWPGQDPLGKRFKLGGEGSTAPWLTVVGMIRTSRHNAVAELPRAEMYLPHAQMPSAAGGVSRSLSLVVRASGDPRALVDPVREVLSGMDGHLPLAEIRTMEEIAAQALARPRFATVLLSVFAALALTLAAVGIYGTQSLLVTERAREIGIRLALGAGRPAIVRMVLGQALVMSGLGIALGMSGAVLVTRLLASLLYQVSTLDPATFATVPALLGGVAVMASLWPARRATAIDPVSALRRE
jgi:putative ABC transport system permease protein